MPDRKARAHARGVTLIEILVVITLIGVISTVMAIGIMKYRSDALIAATKTACTTARSAAQGFLATHTGGDCPTVESLKADRALDEGFSTRDPWGGGYRVACGEHDAVSVQSAGPDKKDGTEDDIIAPLARR